MIKIIDSVNIEQAANKKVVSFCLFHNPNRPRDYLSGVFVNRKLIKKIYPDWTMRVYIRKDYPLEGITQIKKSVSIDIFIQKIIHVRFIFSISYNNFIVFL